MLMWTFFFLQQVGVTWAGGLKLLVAGVDQRAMSACQRPAQRRQRQMSSGTNSFESPAWRGQ